MEELLFEVWTWVKAGAIAYVVYIGIVLVLLLVFIIRTWKDLR